MSMIIPNTEELVSAELVSADHRYRKLLTVVDWTELAKPLCNLSHSVIYIPKQVAEAMRLSRDSSACSFSFSRTEVFDRWSNCLLIALQRSFSKVSSKARYRGKLKVYFQVLMESIVMNLKRLITIGAEAIPICQP